MNSGTRQVVGPTCLSSSSREATAELSGTNVTVRRLLVAGALYGTLAITPSGAASYEISEPQFSVWVREDLRIVGEFKGKVQRSKLSSGRLWISLTIVGGRNALEELQKSHQLILKAETWSSYRRLRTYPMIGITPEKWERDREGLRNEYEEKRVFTWRTRFYTDQTTHEKIFVKFLGADDEDVTLVGSDGAYQAQIDLVP